MERVSRTTRIRQRRKQKENRFLGPLAIGCGVILSLALALSALGAVSMYRGITQELPSPEILPALLEPPSGLLLEPTRFYDRSGTREVFSLANPAAAGATYLEIDPEHPIHIPASLVTATLAASDPATWAEDSGARPGTTGDSHRRIAENLVSNLMLSGEPAGWQRDLRLRLLVDQVQDQFGPEQLMEWFLNSADYGNLAFGADAASRVYFDKPATELTLAESAVLAAVAEAPALNPLDTREEAAARGRLILRQALESGLINTPAFRKAINAKVEFSQANAGRRHPFEAFINLVQRQLEARLGRDHLLQGGLRIRTTIDYDLQIQADCAVQTQINRLKGNNDPILLEDGEPCEAARLIKNLDLADIPVWVEPAGSAVIMDPKTGEVLALAGDPIPGQDPAQLPGRPPGTVIAPYVHLAAYTRGLSPGSQVWDIPANLPEALEGLDSSEWDYQGPVRLRSALANDYLVPTLQLLEQLGPSQVWSSLPQLGFNSLDSPAAIPGFELLLGDGEVTLLEIVHGFSAFSNLGLLIGEESVGPVVSGQAEAIQPVTILQIEDSNGNFIEGAQDKVSRPVISSQLAYLITHSLSDESARWESMGHPNLLEVGRPAAAKIGETEVGRDLWTVGFTPNLLVGTWFGEAAEISVGSNEGSRPPAEIAAGPWHALMQYASANLPPEAWERPPGVSEVEVCDPSGLLPTLICPRIVQEVFLQGNEPVQLDTLYRKYLVNRETGRLATVFTPPELIEEQVYIEIPPTAADWAAGAGIATPPDDYDLIFAPATTAPGLSLESPEMFAYVRGKTPLTGTAAGPGFEYYRIQAGQGLNPQSWIQIGDDVTEEREDEQLGLWDTEGLSGLYAIQLLVVRDDQRVDKITIQVTVDNTPPEVRILSPSTGMEFDFPQVRSSTLQLEVSDDLSLDRVEISLDGQLLATLVEPPYTIPIPINPGSHQMAVTAYDRAGNQAVARASYEVK